MKKRLICRGWSGLLVCAVAFTTQQSFAALVLHYEFESVSGVAPTQTTLDSSGTYSSSNPTPLVNALVGFGTNTPGTDYPQQVAGPVANGTVQSLNPNNGMQFYGGTSTNVTRVEIADGSAGILDTAVSNFTVALWLNPSTNTGDRFAIGKMGGSGQRGWQIASTPSASAGVTNLSLDYFASSANSTDRSFAFPDALPLNTWTHVAFTFNGIAGTEALYINGVAQSLTNIGTLTSVPATFNGLNNTSFRVGHRGGTASGVGGWIGGIDDVRIYNETLDASQVQALMTPVPEPSGVILLIGASFGVAGFRFFRKLRS